MVNNHLRTNVFLPVTAYKILPIMADNNLPIMNGWAVFLLVLSVSGQHIDDGHMRSTSVTIV